MREIKKISIVIILILITGCGYTPLINSENNNFNIEQIDFEGDRKINNFIQQRLNEFTNNNKASVNYKVLVNSKFEKTVINKDSAGNPKNYNIRIISEIEVSYNENKLTNTFIRDNSLAAQKKKISEKEMEKTYTKNLANLIAEDIIFFLTNK